MNQEKKNGEQNPEKNTMCYAYKKSEKEKIVKCKSKKEVQDGETDKKQKQKRKPCHNQHQRPGSHNYWEHNKKGTPGNGVPKRDKLQHHNEGFPSIGSTGS